MDDLLRILVYSMNSIDCTKDSAEYFKQKITDIK